MKNNRTAGKGGFVKIVIIVVVALLALSYFGFNLRSLMEQPTTRDNFAYAASTTAHVWNSYLKKPATYVWDQIFLNLIWNPAVSKLRKIERVDMTASSTGSY